MASIYQKSIQSLSIHLQNSRVHDLVSRAIKRLEAQEAEARELKHLEEDVAPVVFAKLQQLNSVTPATKLQIMKTITHEFLCSQRYGEHKFTFIQDDTYSLKYPDGIVYTFLLTIVPRLKMVMLERSPDANGDSKTAAFCFDYMPSLAVSDREKDEKILKECLIDLRIELKICWEESDDEVAWENSEETFVPDT